MDKVDEKIVRALPSSFVSRRLKLAGDAGSGEAKLFLGSVRNKEELNQFFNDFSDSNIYKFDKNNLLIYLQQVKIEYIYQKINRYTNVDLIYWKEKYLEINPLQDDNLIFQLTKFTDKSRYYIRSLEDIFKNTLRQMALPLITNIKIEKHQNGDNFIYIFLLELNTEYSEQGRTEEREVEEETEFNNILGENVIYCGAPGTGKSHNLDEKSREFDFLERVTFYPEYTHDDFIGCFMPCMSYVKNDTTEYIAADGTISTLPGKPVPYYAYIAGPFTVALVQALNNPDKNVLLIVEELNRANAAGVFGEFFQLLDRKNGASKYTISVSNEYSEYLSSKVETYTNGQKVTIPSNLTIYATMNSADQGVNPLDSAFKRRWNFEYVPINFSEAIHRNYEIIYAKEKVTWEIFALTINEQLKKKEINEDKHLAQYFINEVEIKDIYKFASKVLLYLFDDVLKFNRRGFFKSDYKTFSDLLNAFIEGEKIFNFEFQAMEENTNNIEADTVSHESVLKIEGRSQVSEGRGIQYAEQQENHNMPRVAEN